MAHHEEEQPSEALIVFAPSGKRGRFPIGTPLLHAARQLGVDLDSVCGGRGICGRCKVLLCEGEFACGGRGICGRCKVLLCEGEFAKLGIRSKTEHLSPLSEPEERFAHGSGLTPGERLSCHTRILGDALIDVPAASQLHRQVVRKDYQSRDLNVNPLVHLHYIELVELNESSLDRSGGELEHLLQALAEQWQLANLSCTPHL
ncbi:MAG: 2Fe-2S iron-sulfur cluster binding domain-containing protein, partial [Deltaproteobacteria bacterium]|nr:2Fe-2S iron-sulfur cluster binding domain-containing protein [Deltaproteobacteria bacterium]